MLKRRLTVLTLISALYLPVLTFAQQNDTRTVRIPADYTTWTKTEIQGPHILRGTEVVLQMKFYRKTDLQALLRHTLTVLHNLEGSEWLALYVVETGEKTDDGAKTKDSHAYMFEKRANDWALVKIFKSGKDEELFQFLKETYQLEVK